MQSSFRPGKSRSTGPCYNSSTRQSKCARIALYLAENSARADTGPGQAARSRPASCRRHARPHNTSGTSNTGQRGQDSAIQTLLNQLGFDPGPANGAIGEQTRNAIQNYQRELGLPVDGEPSTRLLAHLRQIAGAC